MRLPRRRRRLVLSAAAVLLSAAAGLVIWFVAAFAEAIRERDERSDVHMALLVGSVLVGGALFTYAVATGVLVACASAFMVREHLPEVESVAMPQT